MTTEPTAGLKTDTLKQAITRLLESKGYADVVITRLSGIAGDRGDGELKHIGYGKPTLIEFSAGGEPQRLVFRTAAPNWFGHDRRADRADLALLAADSFAEVPKHIQVIDVGGVSLHGDLVSLSDVGEFYLLTTYVPGTLYAADLRAIEARGHVEPRDIDRVRALARYLAELHTRPIVSTPEIYERALRDLVGSGEGIFGLTDSYPDDGPVPRERLLEIEQLANRARHRLRGRHHRLRLTHGDFHPYNLLFREGTDFSVIDASRGGRGDPADDLAALAVNYLFGGVVAQGAWQDGHRRLFEELWATYLDLTDDQELLVVFAPFLAWRLLVVASPVWYPTITPLARDRLLTMAERSLSSERVSLDTLAQMAAAPLVAAD